MGTIIEVKNLSKHFSKNTVLNNINLTIPEGKIFGIIGISGSGKTTLLNTIVGFYGLNKKIITTNSERILKLLKLDNTKNVVAENLSGGMKRRLDLACALIHYPRVLILDEPTEELDPRLRGEMIDLIKQISKTGTTVLVTSHLLWEMERLCDEIAIIHNTGVLNVGSVDQLRSIYGKHEELHLETESKNYEQLLANLDKKIVTKAVTKGTNLILSGSIPAEELLHEVLRALEKHKDKITMIDIRKPSLNDVFLRMIEEQTVEKERDHEKNT